VEELFEAGKKNLGTLVSSDPVLREVPLGMPMDMARTIMEKHGFSCWAAVQDDKGTYLRCIAYKSSPRPYKICINLYYDPRRNNITGVDTVVDYDTWHGLHGT